MCNGTIVVPTKHKRTSTVGIGSPAWVKLLGRSIDAIGKESFPLALVDALESLTDFDYSVVFAYYQSERPLCLFHTFSPNKRIVFVDDYLKGSYLLDPFFKACDRQVDTGLYRLRDIAPARMSEITTATPFER